MVRRLLIGNVATAMVLIGATPALADPPITETINEKVVNTFVDFLPNSCERGGPLYTFTTTNNRVEHSTTFDDGRIQGTVLETGTFVAVPLEDPSLPTYTGKFTNLNSFFVENGMVVTNASTTTVHGTGSDGSTFKIHFTVHTNVPPTGTINEFFRCH
jgi:hypothetical protein